MTDVTPEQVAAFVTGHDFTPEVWCEHSLHGGAPQRAVWYSRSRCCRGVAPVCAVCVGRMRLITRSASVVHCTCGATITARQLSWDTHLVELIRIKGAS